MGGQLSSLKQSAAVQTDREISMKPTGFGLCLLLLLVIFNAACAHEAYKYSDPLYPLKRVSINVTDRLFQIADVAESMTVCAINEPYICVSSRSFDFHFPRRLREGQTEWTVDGATYRVDNSYDYEISGRKSLVTRIIRTKGKEKTAYLFSDRYGLIGIAFFVGDPGPYVTFLLDAECGFGAPATCTRTQGNPPAG